MLVYGHRTFRLSLPRFVDAFVERLDALPAAPSHDAIVSLLIDLGEAGCAHADALCPDCDDEHEALGGWSDATLAMAAALCASWSSDADAVARHLDACATLVRQLTDAEAAPVIPVEAHTGEGFAVYGLYPEQYIESAAQIARTFAPTRVLCIGLRSIGYTLAHVAAAALASHGISTSVRSVRPRGHPFDRRLVLGAALTRRIAASSADIVAIVDEGPGLSGSSFAAGAAAARDLGVAAGRIVLMPSWHAPAAALNSERARAVWNAHRIVSVSFEETWLASKREPFDAGVRDISAGAWRALVFPQSGVPAPREWPPVHPQHERRKYTNGTRLLRFAGLGRYGEAAAARAAAMAASGFGPPPGRLIHGFIERGWIAGAPLAAEGVTLALVERIAEYMSFVARAFPLDVLDDVAQLQQMMQDNVRETIGGGWERTIDRLADGARPLATRRIAIDGRMMPHEWIAPAATATARHPASHILKVDALDHHADDFFPGCRDIAWDVAGAIVEFDLDEAGAIALTELYREKSGDATIFARLPFYCGAYLAYRAGYASLAAASLAGTPDGRRFTSAGARYRRLLTARLSTRA